LRRINLLQMIFERKILKYKNRLLKGANK